MTGTLDLILTQLVLPVPPMDFGLHLQYLKGINGTDSYSFNSQVLICHRQCYNMYNATVPDKDTAEPAFYLLGATRWIKKGEDYSWQESMLKVRLDLKR